MRPLYAAAWAIAILLVGANIVGANTHASTSTSTGPDSHAPIGVMGDHTHHEGEIMFSYRFMTMRMSGNLDGSSSVSPTEIATSAPNRFSAPGMGMPPTLRVVPTEMTMDMHMFGVMYAPSDRVTLMAMLNYVEKEMDHTTFMGPMGTTRLGTFTTKTSGIGDTSLSALINLSDSHVHRWHATLGLSLPTGSLDEEDQILTPMNTRPSPRLPYPMQLGSGTYDLMGGLTYAGSQGAWGWGGQWQSVVPLGENDEDYTLGDQHKLTGWISRRLNDRLSLSARLSRIDRDNIDGMDPLILAPVQTADPDRQGFARTDLSIGLNFLFPGDAHRLAVEFGKAISQDVDGPQMESDWQATIGWQWAR
ncbi:MAG: transporter [Pseudomonadales bacterium]|nr:transporter [Pseudomonadales bacterium]